MNKTMMALALLFGVGACSDAFAGDYPDKPIHIVVPFAAGGASDVVARLAGEGLTKAWGQQVVIDNKPGAAGNIGTRQAANASPDGYTLLHTSSAILINPSLYKDPGYKLDQFKPLLSSGSNCSAVVVNPAYGAATLDDVVAQAAKETLHYGTAGIGSTPYIAGEMLFNQLAKVKARHVPYTGGGPALTAVLSNQVPVAVLTVATGNLVELVKNGQLRAVALTCAKRHDAMPDVPTLLETRFSDYGADSTWGGFFVPADTPHDVVAKLGTALNAIFEQQTVKSRIAAMGLSWQPQTPAQFAATVKSEATGWDQRVKRIGLEPQ